MPLTATVTVFALASLGKLRQVENNPIYVVSPEEAKANTATSAVVGIFATTLRKCKCAITLNKFVLATRL
jgi:hypothetical protein